MATAVIEKRFYNAETLETSEIYALMLIEVDLPPAPYVGMNVRSGIGMFELDRIWWDVEEQKFSCIAKPSFLDRLGLDAFDDWIEWQKDDGWRLRIRSANDSFVAKTENLALEDSEKFRVEISKLSEPSKLEFRRRLDESDYLGRLLVTEKRALEILREKLKSKTMEAKNVVWGLGIGLVGMALINWIFPEWMKENTGFWISLLFWGMSNFAYNELIFPHIVAEIEKRREAYEDACYSWSLATGMRWTEKVLVFNHDLHYSSGDATAEENQQHWTSVEHSIMRIVRNRYALSRYDMD